MTQNVTSVKFAVHIYATYVGESIDVDQLKKDVMDNVNDFIENKGLRMSEHNKTPPDAVELSKVSADAETWGICPQPPSRRRVYVIENEEGKFEVQTSSGDRLRFAETFSEDTPIEEIRAMGYVPILERFASAQFRCYLGSEDLFVKV